MLRFVSTLLLLLIIIFNTISLTACFKRADEDDESTSDNENQNGEGSDTIKVPEYKDYGRGTVNFSEIVYSRPDVAAIIGKFENVTEKIKENAAPYSELLDSIYALEEDYDSLLGMYAYANIKTSIDNTSEHWNTEFEFISTEYPAFVKAVEDLFVAAANSEHAKSFEEDYFGEGFVDEYADGGIYTEKIVDLMSQEAELEAEYQSLSFATVTITYYGLTDTVDNILNHYKNRYGENSSQYAAAERDCSYLYEAKSAKISEDILIELFKIRRSISDEFGHDSYAEFAYDNIYHDYSEEQFENFAEDISRYILPVYIKLSNYIFNQYSSYSPKSLGNVQLINDTFDMIDLTEGSLEDIFSYMLQHGLYNIAPDAPSRFAGAFTTYIDHYNAPFVFMSSSGSSLDYTTLCHEFGHFADAYLNDNAPTSLDLSEVSSQAFELLALTKFDEIIDGDELNKLIVYEMENFLSCIIFQSFYAMFEHIAYDIEYEDITLATLNSAVAEAAESIGLNSAYLNQLSHVMIPHIFLYPFYVQSYATSAAVSLEIYFEEIEEEGVGFEIYESLLIREDEDLSFEEYISNANLCSPFEKDRLKYIADKIHYKLLGAHYFNDLENGSNAA